MNYEQLTKNMSGGYDIEWDYRKAAAKLRNPIRKFKYAPSCPCRVLRH